MSYLPELGGQLPPPDPPSRTPMVVHLSLQADGNVTFEDIPVFGVCRPACLDYSLYLLVFVLVLFLGVVALSQVYVAFNIFYRHIVNVYWGVVYNHHLCLCDVHLKTHSNTLHRIVLVAYGVVIVVFLCIRICHQQSGDW